MKRRAVWILSLAAVVISCSKSQTELPNTTPQTTRALTVEQARAVVEKSATKGNSIVHRY